MILGDFNAHNPLWGSDNLTPKGMVLETFISQNDLCLYNDGSYTFLHSGNGTYSAIDLSIACPTLFDRFTWEVHDDCCGSDHFPIILKSKEAKEKYRGVFEIHGVYRPGKIYMGTCSLSRLSYGDFELREENIIFSYKIKYECLIHLPYSKTTPFPKLTDI